MDYTNFHKTTYYCFLATKIEDIIIDKGDTLFKQGEKIDYIYFLSKGELNILKKNQMMWQAHLYEFIGISSFFIGEANYSYTVKACKKSTLLRVSLNDFNLALNKNPQLNTSLMMLFCQRIKLTLNRAKIQSKLSRKKRLVTILIEKGKKLGRKDKLILTYSISDIAEFVNVSNNFAKELLTELQSKNLILIRENKIEIIDFNGLKLVSKMKGFTNLKES